VWTRGATYTRIKLCLFEYLEAAYEASHIGADALGFHMLRETCDDWSSKARLFSEILIELPPTVEPVLLIDFPVTVVEAVLRRVPFKAVQLYPDWDPETLCLLRARHGVRIIKVMSAQDYENEPSDPTLFLERYAPVSDAILLDSFRDGGTGLLADIGRCARIIRESSVPVFIAGGLTPENVGERIQHLRPFGVDVESGVSVTTPSGRSLKSIGLCRRFVRAVEEVDRELGRVRDTGRSATIPD